MRAQARPIPHPTSAVETESPARSRLPSGRLVVALALTTLVVVAALVLSQRGDDDAASTASVDGATYLVRAGDTTASVAEVHGVSVDRLMEANGLTPSDSIDPGSRLTIPALPTEGRSPPRALLADDRKLTYAPLFERAAREEGLPPGLLEALAWHESEWVNALVDEDGRTGLGQLRPETIDFLRRRVVDAPVDPEDPEDNITLTAAYLGHLLEEGEGDRAAALAGYYLGLEDPAGGTWDLDVVEFVREVLLLTPDFAGTIDPAATDRGAPTTGA